MVERPSEDHLANALASVIDALRAQKAGRIDGFEQHLDKAEKSLMQAATQRANERLVSLF